MEELERKGNEIRRALLSSEFTSWTSFFIQACKILLSWLIALIVLPFITLLYIYKISVETIAQILDPDLRPVSSFDAQYVMDKLTEQDSIQHDQERSQLCSIVVYAKFYGGKTNIVDLAERIQKLFIDNNSDWNWKVKCYLVRFCGYSFWKVNPNTRASDHVRSASLHKGESIQDFINKWVLKPYPPKSPLWEVLIIDAGEEEFNAFRIHHSLGDGLTVHTLGGTMFEATHHPLVETIINHPPIQWSLLEKIKLIVKGPSLFLTIAEMVLRTPAPYTLDIGRKPDQLLAVTPLNFNEVKKLSKKRGVAFNTVLLTIYGGAIRRFLLSRKSGLPVPKDLLIPIALPWPGRPKNFIGNHFSAMMGLVPTNISDPLQRMDQVQANLSKNFLANIVFTQMVHPLLGLLPSRLLMHFRLLTGVRHVLSPFLTADVYTLYDGRVAESINVVTGLFFPAFGISTITTSVRDQLIWSIIGDRSLFKSQDGLNLFAEKYIVEEFEELLSAAERMSSDEKEKEHKVHSKEENCSG